MSIKTKKAILLYVNLNYFCNNKCLFCASSSKTLRQEESKAYLNIGDFRKILNKLAGIKISSAIINGGEPTLNRDIIEINKLMKRRKIFSMFFTNGRRLADTRFAQRFIKSFYGCLSVPLYGHNSSTHDHFTGVKGSFRETIAGIRNIIQLREKLGLPILLEIKLLFLATSLKESIKIYKYILNKFPTTDSVSLNHLIQSDAVKRSPKLIPRIDSLRRAINGVLDYAIKLPPATIKKTSIYRLPLCLIDKKNKIFFKSTSKNNLGGAMIYIDPFSCSLMKKGKNKKTITSNLCSKCCMRSDEPGYVKAECPFKGK